MNEKLELEFVDFNDAKKLFGLFSGNLRKGIDTLTDEEKAIHIKNDNKISKYILSKLVADGVLDPERGYAKFLDDEIVRRGLGSKFPRER